MRAKGSVHGLPSWLGYFLARVFSGASPIFASKATSPGTRLMSRDSQYWYPKPYVLVLVA